MRILVISILALSLSAVAFAADPTTEVTGGSTVSAVINPGTNGGNTTATVALAGAAAFAVGSSELQLGVAPSLAIATGGGSTITTFSLFGLARLNFSGPIQDSAFIEVRDRLCIYCRCRQALPACPQRQLDSPGRLHGRDRIELHQLDHRFAVLVFHFLLIKFSDEGASPRFFVRYSRCKSQRRSHRSHSVRKIRPKFC